MTAVVPRTSSRARAELPPRAPRQRRRYTYFVWPYGSQAAYAVCLTLSVAMQEATQARMHGTAAVWIVRSDGYEVQAGCTYCGKEEEALGVPSHPALRDYWCTACWEAHGTRIRARRLSPLQSRILCWLRDDTTRAPGVSTSSHTALVKALGKDKGNVSKSLQNLAEKNLIDIRYSPGGLAVSVELTPTGWYKAHSLHML